MSAGASVWGRMEHWFNPLGRDDTVPLLAQSGYQLTERVEPIVVSGDSPPSPPPVRSSPDSGSFFWRMLDWRPGRKREQKIQQLQTGYDHVVDLVETLRDHLHQQNHRGDQMIELLTRLSTGVGELPSTVRDQGEALHEMAHQVQQSLSQTQAMTGLLRDLPDVARSQHEALRSISQQLERSGQGTTQLSEQMQAINLTIQRLGHASSDQVRILQEIHNTTQYQQIQLADLCREQTRRLTVLACLAGVAVVVTVAAVILHLVF